LFVFHPVPVDDLISVYFCSKFTEGVVPFNICVKIYFVYFNLLAISAFFESNAVANGYSLFYPFALIYVTNFCSLERTITVLSVKST
jgi:hypothetical protein